MDTNIPVPVLDARAILELWLAGFDDALVQQDYKRAAAGFMPDGYWRDFLAFTWDIRTFQHPSEVEASLRHTHRASGASGFHLEGEPIKGRIAIFGETVESFFAFETRVGDGRGYLRLLADPQRPGSFKAATMLTALQELKQFPERTGRRRPRKDMGVPQRGLENWLDRRKATREFSDRDPEVVIIGAGQAGLTLAARLGQLDVDTLVVDRMERVGDNWRKRYHSLALHNQIYSNHLPYMPFPDTWPVYIPKDMIADWFEFYVTSMELNVWMQTTFLGAEYDESDKRWTVRLQKVDGAVRTMRPSHVVMAVGVNGTAKMPKFAGQDAYAGTIVHSSCYDSTRDVSGKTVLVVGTGNSAHDVAQELHLRGADVTMLQRSSTTVVSIEPSSSRATTLYRDNAGLRPLEDIDLMGASTPFDLQRQLHGPLSRSMAETDKDLLDGLRKAGFRLDNGEDDTGFYMKLVRYLGGYYLNVGASDLIIEGKIKLKHGEIERLTAKEVMFADGTTLATNLIVLGTGWGPLQQAMRALFGDAVADRVGPIWGLGPKGELRNMWSRTAQPGFYVMGGTLTMCRSFSRYTALLIKATLEGLIDEPAEVQGEEALV